MRATLAFQPLDTLARDVRYAIRSFRRHKTFTAVILLCVALGVGANTTVFSFLDSILLRALPVSNPDRLVEFWWSVEEPGPDVPWPGLRTTLLQDLWQATPDEDDLVVMGGGQVLEEEGDDLHDLAPRIVEPGGVPALVEVLDRL